MVTWDTIDCIERNGVITSYLVEIQQAGAVIFMVTEEVVDQNFTFSGLTPDTNYTFRVAGLNSNTTGSFTEAITIKTDPAITITSNGDFTITTQQSLLCGKHIHYVYNYQY